MTDSMAQTNSVKERENLFSKWDPILAILCDYHRKNKCLPLRVIKQKIWFDESIADQWVSDVLKSMGASIRSLGWQVELDQVRNCCFLKKIEDGI